MSVHHCPEMRSPLFMFKLEDRNRSDQTRTHWLNRRESFVLNMVVMSGKEGNKDHHFGERCVRAYTVLSMGGFSTHQPVDCAPSSWAALVPATSGLKIVARKDKRGQGEKHRGVATSTKTK